MIFASGYARIAWPSRHDVRVALWVVPALSIVAALTNRMHGLVWPDDHPDWTRGGDRRWSTRMARCTGPTWPTSTCCWRWARACWSIGVRTFPPPYRPQFWAIVVGTLLPLSANLLYMTRLRAAAASTSPP